MKDKSKKWVKLVFPLLFLLVLMITVVFLTYLYRPVTVSRKNLCGFYAEEQESLDMVYIGGSVVYSSWQPLAAFAKYGFTSYDFAADSLPPQVIKYSIKEVLKTQKPQLFVIDLRPFEYADFYDETEDCLYYQREAPLRNVIDNMKFSLNRAALIENCVPKAQGTLSYHIDLAKYHSLIGSFLNAENWSYGLNQKTSFSKGFLPGEGWEYKEAFPDTEQGELPLIAEIDTIFLDLLSFCKEENLKVLFVVHPYVVPEQSQRKFLYMERKITEYGLDYLDMNRCRSEMGIDYATDFYNYDHINLLGADKFTDYLGGYLTENYGLPDRRQDKALAGWLTDYEIWNTQMEEIRKSIRGKVKE